MSENEQVAVASEVPSPSPPVPLERDGTSLPDTPPKKARSGFERQKRKVEALVRRIQELEGDHENLLTDYEGLFSDHERLERDYAKLELAFNEITELNTELASELRQLKQRRPEPVRYGGLMGM
jgi:DNA repair exonuclease SbcCD ATPase subunit